MPDIIDEILSHGHCDPWHCSLGRRTPCPKRHVRVTSGSWVDVPSVVVRRYMGRLVVQCKEPVPVVGMIYPAGYSIHVDPGCVVVDEGAEYVSD